MELIWLIILSLALLVLTVVVAGIVVNDRRVGARVHDQPRAAHRRPDQIAGPPMIDGATLRDWLIHRHQSDQVWPEVVAEFYNRAASVPAVADYFGPVLARAGGWEDLQHHFTSAIILVTHTGVTRRLLDRLTAAHSEVRNSAGEPITAEIFGQVVNTLVEVLRERGVPERGIAELARTVAPFRGALVGPRAI